MNFVTITTMLLDETVKELKKLEEDFHHYRYNKNYYEKLTKKKIEFCKKKQILKRTCFLY